VIDYLVGYEQQLEAAEYFDEARVRALVARIVDRTGDMAACWPSVIAAMLRHTS